MRNLCISALLLFLTAFNLQGQIREGYDHASLAANDDDSTPAVSLGFEVDFYGLISSSAYH